ncbi:toll/interleukin-1 receptor domain-containing protein [Actinokineospora soli]|uniref:Toll/interleukin-1 receptor domain-containing protein n=1 Tax=Actinokineospora soli TaxID=1048753 RepID=A0ABW2TYT5_9PSEU
MTNDMSGPAPIAVFLSYAQIDDEGLGFVDAFRRDLAFYCSADHGRRVEVFYDRASLGWGDEWRSRIRDAVEGALVFLPLVTLTYFERRWCREELLQFYSSARSREVVDLLLPVVVLGHEHITADNPDTAVQIIAGRQQFDFREAAIAGAGSPVWRSTMLRLAGELVAAVGKAEGRLAPAPPPDRERLATAVRSSGQRLGRVIGELTAAMTALLPDLERAVDGGPVPTDLEPAGRRLAHHGVALERAALDLDGHLRAYVDLVMATGTPDQRAVLVRDLRALGASTVPLDQMGDLCGEFLAALRPVESLSVPLRRAVEPTRAGFLAVRTAVGIIKGWMDLGR